MRPACLSIAAFVITFVCAARLASAADALVYRTPAGVELEVDARGLSAIRYHGRVLADGGWGAFDAGGWFKEFRPEAGAAAVDFPEKPTVRSIQLLDDRHARVTQSGGEVTCIATYTFDGEDLLVSTRIENNSASAPIPAVGFSGLTFHFGALPHGLMPVQHITYFQANGIKLCHPGEWQKIGGTWAADDTLGVGTSPEGPGVIRTLTLWDYADWRPEGREHSPDRLLRYFVVSAIPPRGSATFDLKLRVSPDRDWRHLLGPYRDYFVRTYGAVRYRADRRWIATDYLNHSVAAIGPDNPYGFQGGHRRIDTAKGASAFCDTVIPPLQADGGQGVIVWGQGGENPRGAMYRPDFDVLPPEVEANWKTIADRFKSAGLKLGVATRPRDMAVEADWRHDEVININPDDAGHREMLMRRFDRMRKLGCSMFYLDSFGDGFEDVKLMRFLRQGLGPDVLTFAEHQCDAIMPFTGGYSETTLEPASAAEPARWRLWSGTSAWEIYQWLCPGCQMTSRLFRAPAAQPAGLESVDRFFYAHGVTPLLPVSDFSRAGGLKALQAEFGRR